MATETVKLLLASLDLLDKHQPSLQPQAILLLVQVLVLCATNGFTKRSAVMRALIPQTMTLLASGPRSTAFRTALLSLSPKARTALQVGPPFTVCLIPLQGIRCGACWHSRILQGLLDQCFFYELLCRSQEGQSISKEEPKAACGCCESKGHKLLQAALQEAQASAPKAAEAMPARAPPAITLRKFAVLQPKLKPALSPSSSMPELPESPKTLQTHDDTELED